MGSYAVIDTVFGRYVHPMILPFYEEVQMEDGNPVPKGHRI